MFKKPSSVFFLLFVIDKSLKRPAPIKTPPLPTKKLHLHKEEIEVGKMPLLGPEELCINLKRNSGSFSSSVSRMLSESLIQTQKDPRLSHRSTQIIVTSKKENIEVKLPNSSECNSNDSERTNSDDMSKLKPPVLVPIEPSLVSSTRRSTRLSST